MSRRWIALALAVALSACAGGGLFDERITFVEQSPAYSPLEFAGFAGSGPLVEFRGPLPGGASPEQTAAALRLPGFWPQAPFRIAPAPAGAERVARLVLVFGPGGGVDPDAICRGTVNGAGGGAGLGVAATFCRGAAPFGWGRLDHVRPLAPGDPGVTASMRRLFGAIAPRENPNDPRADRGCVFLCG
jgi:hypothetical protein